MFKIAEELMQKIESILTVNQPALAGGKGINVYADCVGNCISNCANSCFRNCAGSCRGNCTGSCQRYAR